MTVNRYCSSSLQTDPDGRARDPRGRGRLLHRRRRRVGEPLRPGNADRVPDTHNAAFAEARAHRAAARRAARNPGRLPRVCPTSTSRWARPPRTSPSCEDVTREEMDEFAALSQQLAVAAQAGRLLRARDRPRDDARRRLVAQRRRPAARHDRRGPRRAEARLPPRRRGHRRQRLPAQRRRRRRPRDERPSARRARLRPLARIVASGVSRARPRDHGPGPRRGQPRSARARAG